MMSSISFSSNRSAVIRVESLDGIPTFYLVISRETLTSAASSVSGLTSMPAVITVSAPTSVSTVTSVSTATLEKRVGVIGLYFHGIVFMNISSLFIYSLIFLNNQYSKYNQLSILGNRDVDNSW